MRGLFVDAAGALARLFHDVLRADDPPVQLNEQAHVDPADLPRLLAGYDVVLNDHTYMPTDIVAQCADLRDIIFLGTGARSYMDPDALAGHGVTVHTIRSYGDTAVAEHAIALMWAAARGIARMDRDVRNGLWTRIEGPQLTGRTIGLIGFGGIGAEVARIAAGSGMRVLAWNRSPKTADGVTFTDIDTLLAESDVVSLHLLLTDETRGFLGADRLGRLRPDAILVNTARGELIDEAALLAALKSGQVGHAALDVFETEPLPAEHPFIGLDNVTLSAHSAFRTPEASRTLLRRALDIAASLAAARA